MTVSSTVASLLALALTAATLAQDPPPPPGGQPPREGGAPRQGPPREEGGEGRQEGRPRGGRGGQGAQPMNVEGAMKAMGRSLKGLKEAVADPAKKADALRMVSDMQRGCATAKMLPLPADAMKGAADDEARTKLQAEYAADMRKLMRMLVDLEDAVAAGKADEAKALIEKVDAARERSHKAFGVDD